MTADERAHNLLLSFLTHEQKKSYLNHQGFTVIGQQTGLPYLLGYNFSASIFTKRYSYCIHLVDANGYYYPYEFPPADHILAQKIIIESDEQRFLEIAKSTKRFTEFAGFAYSYSTSQRNMRQR
jgi:hypothetical protein